MNGVSARVMVLAMLTMVVAGPLAAREFTDVEGRTLEAELVGVQGDNARLELPNGRTVAVPLARLSEPDREFVERWRAANPDLRLQISSTKERKDRTGDSARTRERWVYRITVTNRSQETVPAGLKVRYGQFVDFNDRMARASERRGIARFHYAEIELPEIPPLESVTVETQPMRVESVNRVTREATRTVTERWSENLAGLNVDVMHGLRVVESYSYGSYERYGTEQPRRD